MTRAIMLRHTGGRSMVHVDTVGRLIQAFRDVEPSSDSTRKLDVLLDLDRLDDPRALPFLLGVLGDRGEPESVRIDVLTRLRDAPLLDHEHRRVGLAIRKLIADEPWSRDLRLQAALVLGKFTDVDGVMAALGALLMDTTASIELRYNAFTSLSLAGPTRETVELLRKLRADETIGPCAGGLLSVWGAGEEAAAPRS